MDRKDVGHAHEDINNGGLDPVGGYSQHFWALVSAYIVFWHFQ